MPRSRIGPFAMESPLSAADGNSQVFRGIHLERKKLSALRVFPIPMGMTPESRQAFAAELEELKQLRHPGIVRCYGGGFDSRRAYLAYELVDGESLDQLLQRRERLPWETAIELSQQIAEALLFAHQSGWIHKRLHPGKILVDNQGRAKIADFRKQEVNAIIASKPSQSQSQCMAPEGLQGGECDDKADLYSLGAILYQMLTGRVLFEANSPLELQGKVLNEVPVSVAAQVFDCPVWLNAIVDQLLEKDPSKRPYSAQALLLAFREAERRQSQGVGVIEHVASGFSPLQMDVDRDEAEKLLGIKPKKKKKKRNSDSSIFESVWVLLLALVVAVAGVGWFLWPSSEAQLFARATELLESEDYHDWNSARRDLREILSRFPESEHKVWASDRIEWIEAQAVQRELTREQRFGRKSKWTPAQIKFVEAKEYEDFGDLATALDKYRAIVSLFQEDVKPEHLISSEASDDEEADALRRTAGVVYLSQASIARIEAEGLDENALQELLAGKLEAADEAYESAKIVRAKLIWESIIELYESNQEIKPLVDRARERLAEVNAASDTAE